MFRSPPLIYDDALVEVEAVELGSREGLLSDCLLEGDSFEVLASDVFPSDAEA